MAHDRLTESQAEKVKQTVWPLLPALLRTAQYLAGSAQEAEDLVQETVLKAMTAIDRFEPGTSAKAWLLTILRRTHIDRMRASQRRVRPLSLDAEEGIDPPARPDENAGVFDSRWDKPEMILEGFEDAEVIAALKELPDEVRWTLLLVDVEDMDHQQAALVLDVPEGTIKSRAFRGRGMLRDRLFELARQRGLAKEGNKP
jgi:RNA polymerase sigma-70 factor (ECF subfamily)